MSIGFGSIAPGPEYRKHCIDNPPHRGTTVGGNTPMATAALKLTGGPEEAENPPTPGQKVEVEIIQKRVIRLRLKDRDQAFAVAKALEQEGVLEILTIVGMQANLSPAQRRLASLLSGDGE